MRLALSFSSRSSFCPFSSCSSTTPSSTTTSILSTDYIVLVHKCASYREPEICDPPSFPVSLYVRGYASYLDALHSWHMWENDRALTVHDGHNVLGDTNVWVSVKLWRQCVGRGRSVSHGVGCKVGCPFAGCYKKVDYENDLSTFVQRFGKQVLPKTGRSLIFLPRPFGHLYFSEPFDYGAHDCDFELHLRCYTRGILSGWNIVEFLSLRPWQRPKHCIGTPGWSWDLEGSRLLSVSMHPVFA